MSHSCTVDCGIEAEVTHVNLFADRPTCVGTDQFMETIQVIGRYPMGGDFNNFGFDLVVDQDLEVNQRVVVPTGRTWRVFRDVKINAGGTLVVDGTIISG